MKERTPVHPRRNPSANPPSETGRHARHFPLRRRTLQEPVARRTANGRILWRKERKNKVIRAPVGNTPSRAAARFPQCRCPTTPRTGPRLPQAGRAPTGTDSTRAGRPIVGKDCACGSTSTVWRYENATQDVRAGAGQRAGLRPLGRSMAVRPWLERTAVWRLNSRVLPVVRSMMRPYRFKWLDNQSFLKIQEIVGTKTGAIVQNEEQTATVL